MQTDPVIIFDFFGVVASFDNDIFYERLSQHCSNKAEAFNRMKKNGLMSVHDVITSRLNLREIYHRVVEDYGLMLDFGAFQSAWSEPYSFPMPGMAEIIHRLASFEYRLLILSNVDRYYWDAIRSGHPELQHFHKILLSCDIGMAKPDPEIFALASQAAGREPSRCLLIDDTLANVDAAKMLGFQTHWFRGVPGMLENLRQTTSIDF